MFIINTKKSISKAQVLSFIFMLIAITQHHWIINASAAAVHDIDVLSFDQMKDAIDNAENGDTFNFRIKNDIIFNNTIVIRKGIKINFINNSGADTVNLTANGGSYRHFSTGGTAVSNLSMSLGNGIVLNGSDTGGGIWIYGSDCSLILNGCTITRCKSSGNGGGILVGGFTSRSRLIINDALIEKCQSGSGGGIFVSDCDVEMNSGTITGNYAVSSGGGITTAPGGNKLGSTLTISGGEISNNSVGSYGDGGGINAHDSVVVIKDAEIIDNTGDNFGGGINIMQRECPEDKTKLIINYGTIKGNSVRNYGAGIAIQRKISEFTITGGVITENKADVSGGSNQGGGIYCTDRNTLTMSGGKVINNGAGSGGGIFLNFSNLVMNGNAMISGNEAYTTAGGIYGYQGCAITIDGDAKVNGNKAYCSNNPENDLRGGGGIAILSYGYVSTLTVKGNAIISDNTAVSYGGGIWTYPVYGPAPVINIESGTIENNSANYGGAISMGEITDYTPALSITGGTITKNTTVKNGGAIILKGSTAAISGCKITDNISSTGNGGGIYTDSNSTLTVENVLTEITGNKAMNGNGGGIYTEDTTYENLIIGDQTSFSNNAASAAYAPPNDATNLYHHIKFKSVSIEDHPLNNYDINHTSEEHLAYNVNYDANGGVGSFTGPDIVPGEADVVLTLNDTGISWTDYDFMGWNTQADGGGTTYSPGDQIILKSNIILYAQWAKISEPALPEVSETPKTGDDNVFLWFGIFLLSLSIMVSMLYIVIDKGIIIHYNHTIIIGIIDL